MKLTELNPRWMMFGAARVGVIFDCPGCRGTTMRVPFTNPLDTPAGEWPQSDKRTWARTGDSFENLTLLPSIDTSHFGHWHGHVSGGEISGASACSQQGRREP